MATRVEWTVEASNEFLLLPKRIQQQILKKAEALATTPVPAHAKRLKGGQDIYRVRSGDYRIIYEWLGRDVVTITNVGDRKDVYR